MKNKEKELKYEIEILKRDIIQFERDINRNAEDHYDGYKHSVLIDKIKIKKERVDNINSELKGRQDKEKELIEDEIKFLESFDWNITKDAVNDAVEQIQKTYSELEIEHFAFIVQDQENKIAKIRNRIKELREGKWILN